MAFFYYLLFGMMLSDAGYGVMMVLGTAFVLKKFKVEESLRKTLKMFFYCGISTVFWGALFGSWFGDIIPIICKEFLNIQPPSLALWFEPVADPIKLLLFSFAIGIVHLFAGLAVSFKISWDEGRKLDAILDTVPTYLLVLGAAPLGAGILISVPGILTAIGKYVALAGVVLIVLTAGRSSKNIFARLGLGLYSLYNTAAGYFSDILSYSRLLALGLATGSIAGVINLMGSMVDNITLKAIVLTVVFLVGHPLNMAINLLGAYVHTNRLQFVEFFSKFYEGGGRAFSPLKANTKYIRIKEDI
jgi:V/A-type H+-transporting ATPase subunit I